MNYDNTYVEIDLDAISANFDAIRAKAGVQVMAIVKADAYGHGAVQIARLLDSKCSFFGVSSIAEALELRQAGLTKPILILGYTPVEAFRLVLGQLEGQGLVGQTGASGANQRQSQNEGQDLLHTESAP